MRIVVALRDVEYYPLLSTLMCVICHGSGLIITGHKLRHMSPGHQPLARARPADSKTLVTHVLMNTNWSLEALILFYFVSLVQFIIRISYKDILSKL